MIKSAVSLDLVTFTEDILNGKLQFLCSDSSAIFRQIFENEKMNMTWNETISNDIELRKTFNNVFSKDVEELQFQVFQIMRIMKAMPEEALSYFENYKNDRKGFDASLSFRENNSNEVIKLINSLNIIKDCENTDVPTKIFKLSVDLVASYIFRNFS